MRAGDCGPASRVPPPNCGRWSCNALGWARQRRVVSRQPLMLEQDGVRMLLAPGDPLHPDPAGDEPLAETRFIFVDGRWRPERART